MKKVMCIVLVLCLCAGMLSVLSGCGKKEETPAEPAPATAGGWTVNGEFAEAQIPAEAQEALEKALEGYTGAGFTPVAFLGTQVVAGLNYAFLCKTTIVTAQPVTKLCTVTVYKDLQGNASVTAVNDVELSELKGEGVEFNPADFVGGWNVSEAAGCALPENVQTAFDKATEGLMGVNYAPLALMGSQVVAGQNFAVLCKASTVTAEPQSALAVLTIYADLQGGAELLGISQFSFT